MNIYNLRKTLEILSQIAVDIKKKYDFEHTHIYLYLKDNSSQCVQ